MAKSKKSSDDKGKGKKKKRSDIEVAFDNLKGFCQIGARVSSPGNVPTGHFKLDFAIQYGMDITKTDLSKVEKNGNQYDPSKTLGIPLGKLVEIYGEEGSGKSSLAYRIIGYAQKLGYLTAWIDAEHSYQENLAKLNGCDTNNLLYANMVNHEDAEKVFYAEDIMDKMIIMMKNKVKVIVLDSVAAMVPETLYEAKSKQQFMGLLPRFLSNNLGKLVAHAEQNGTLLIFINQLREKIGQMYGDPKTSPGGHCLHHNASLRLRMMKKNSKDAELIVPNPDTGEDMLIGKHSIVRLIKNRFAQPYTESLDIPIYYQSYFPDIEEIAFDTGRQIKLISVRKGIFNWDGLKIEGRAEFIDHVKSKDLIDDLIEAIKLKAEENNVLLPPEIIQYSGISSECSTQAE